MKKILQHRAVYHILFWVGIIVYWGWGFGTSNNYKLTFLFGILQLPGHLLVVYPLLYLLIPRYLIKKQYLFFLLGFSGLLVAAASYNYLVCVILNTPQGIVRGTPMPYIHVAGIAGSIKLVKHWYQAQQKTAEVQKERLIAELELLKSQIHPHFLFNTLNNLYAHTLSQSAQSPEIVLKLSQLLRFMIYDTKSEFIQLNKEVELLKNYVDLEQLRYGNRLDISISVTGESEGKMIAPLLLLPFVENSFKYGTSNQLDTCWINLDIDIEDERMYVKLVNSKDPDLKTDGFPTARGFGLSNVKRRLELLYPNAYSLVIKDEEDMFLVSLTLPLREFKKLHSVKSLHSTIC